MVIAAMNTTGRRNRLAACGDDIVQGSFTIDADDAGSAEKWNAPGP
jgi:hypothetical protein